MDLIIQLFLTFAKIALFNFGGGFVMISLISKEIIDLMWLTKEQFDQVIAIAQITPGAIAINTATYVGYKIAGFVGSLAATLAIPVPSFLIVIFISPILLKYKDHGMNKMIFYGIRAVVVGLIINAAIIVAGTPFYANHGSYQLSKLFSNPILPNFIASINIGSICIFLLSLLLIIKYKLSPILVLFISGILGVVVFSF